MSESKRLWIVAQTITSADGYISTSQFQHFDADSARHMLSTFGQRCTKDAEYNVPSFSTETKGQIMKLNPDYLEDGSAGDKFIPTGGIYCGTMESFVFDPEDLADAERDYEVEVRVTTSTRIYVTVRADSDDAAEYEAKDQIENGDHDDKLECPDDIELEVESCCEA